MSGFRRRSELTGSPLSSRLAQWTQPGFIVSIQRGTITITNATSGTATITAVDVSQSRLRLLGVSATFLGSQTNDLLACKVVLTNATTITMTVNTNPTLKATVTASYEITQYAPGVIKSIQRGTVLNNATATITTVNTAKTEVDFLGVTGSDVNTNYTSMGRVVLTNATTVTPTSPGTAGTDTLSYQVVEFY